MPARCPVCCRMLTRLPQGRCVVLAEGDEMSSRLLG
jgi:hypothetical protein